VAIGTKSAGDPYFGRGIACCVLAIDTIHEEDLVLGRGISYRFNVNISGHTFYLTTDPTGGSLSQVGALSSGVTNNNIASGTLTFAPSAANPDLCWYMCDIHSDMGWQIHLVNTPLAGSLSATASSGLASFSGLAILPAGAQTLKFTSGSFAPLMSNLTVSPSSRAALTVRFQPANGTHGTLAPQPQIEIRDAGGNLVTSDSSTVVTVAIKAGTPATGGGTLGGTTMATATNGVASFTDLSISGAGVGYVLTFTAGGLSVDSASFDLN
jgi:hypothetical protein